MGLVMDLVAGNSREILLAVAGDLPREEKPTIRLFACQIVEFARLADRAPDVILAWSL